MINGEKNCPAVGASCIKEKCLAYTPMQEEHYDPRWWWQERTINYVILGRCSLLNIDFRVWAERVHGSTPTTRSEE